MTRQDDRRLLIEIAALAVAAVEALDREPLYERAFTIDELQEIANRK